MTAVLCGDVPRTFPPEKSYALEKLRLGSMVGFKHPECKSESTSGAKATMLTLAPAPGKLDRFSYCSSCISPDGPT